MTRGRQRRYKALVIVLVAIIVGSLVWGMNQPDQKPYRIVMIPKMMDEGFDFWQSLVDGGVLAAQEYNVEIEIVATETEEDYLGQIELIEEALESEPDAIVVAPNTFSDTTDTLKKITEKDIPLVLMDSTIDEEIYDSLVATNNIEAGRILGELGAELIAEGGKIGIVSHVEGSSTAVDREQGVREGLGSAEKNIVEVVHSGSSYDKAYELTKQLIETYPDIELIIGLNENSAVGAARAVKDMSVADSVKMIGFDSSVEEIQLMEEGVFEGIVIQKPVNMGYLSVEQAVKLIEGKSVEQHIDSGSQLITIENMYEEDNQKLLFPFGSVEADNE